MAAAMAERDFVKLVRSYGFFVQSTSRHHEIVDASGRKLMNFAVYHKKGGRREVKNSYVAEFKKLVGAKP